MGQLIRARSTEDKSLRRSALQTAARELFEQRDYDSVTIAEIARKARVAKGTVFLYFDTKEALFLDLLDELLHEWLGALHEAVAHDDRPWPSARLARILTDSLAERPMLNRLLPVGAHVLEQNVSAERAAQFRHRLLRRFFGTGALIEQRLGLSRPGDGVQLLQFTHALLVGLRSSDGDPADLRTALTVLYNGFHRK